MKTVKSTRMEPLNTFKSLCMASLLSFTGTVAIAAEPQVTEAVTFDEAAPLLAPIQFRNAADASLSSEGPGAGDDLQSLKAKRFSDLKSKLNELSGLLSTPTQPNLVRKPELPRTSNTAVPSEAGTKSIPGVPPVQNEMPAQSPKSLQPADRVIPALQPDRPVMDQAQPEVRQEPAHAEPEDGGPPEQDTVSRLNPPEKFPGIPVIERGQEVQSVPLEEPLKGPIDRFSLACSLFGTGDFEACLKVTRQVNLKDLSREDQIWMYYMQACCHRKAGRVDDARVLYRQIVSDSESDWMKDPARWWLDNLNAKTKVSEDITRLKDTLRAWEVEIATLGK